eukprot:96386_1
MDYNKMAEQINQYVQLPPLGIASALFTTIQIYYTSKSHSGQKTKPWAYSKFRKETTKDAKKSKSFQVGPRMQAALSYSLPFISSAAFLCYQFYSRYYNNSQSIMDIIRNLKTEDKAVLLPTFMIFSHFLKRILECTFVHKYSSTGGSAMRALTTISLAYTQMVLPSLYFQNLAPCKYDKTRIKIGLTVYILGLTGNIYHHYILSSVRKDVQQVKNERDNKKKYTIPTGGLFGFVWTPHYMFELIGWYGMAITANTLNYWLMAATYTSYLTGRAVSTKEWYLKTFKDDPQLRDNKRKAIIPFIY